MTPGGTGHGAGVTLSREPADQRTWHAVVHAGLDAPGDARRWADRWVRGFLEPRRAEDAMLIITELVTNAVLHSGLREGDPIHVTARVADDRVRIGVCDCGRGFELTAPPRLPRDPTPGGRGLWIVNRLADRLLVDGSTGRVVVEMSRSPEPVRSDCR